MIINDGETAASGPVPLRPATTSPAPSDSGSVASRGAAVDPGSKYPMWRNTAVSGGPLHAGPGAGPGRSRKTFGMPVLVGAALGAGLLGGVAAVGAGALLETRTVPAPASTALASAQVIVNNADSVTAVSAAAQKAAPSVVTISAASGGSGGTGSGIILDVQGDILTNTHVVTLDGQTANPTIEVSTSDGNVYPGTVVGTDPSSDLAVVKIDAPNLVPAVLGDSSKVNVGDTAIAIGAPLGLQGTVTDGIISTLDRTISIASSAPQSAAGSAGSNGRRFRFAPPNGSQDGSASGPENISIDVLQTDAAINPGNSGGPLLNTSGEVIGVNVAIASAGDTTAGAQSGSIGVGFSIQINNAKRIFQEIIATGSATHGQLGANTSSQTAGTGSQFTVGAEVSDVTAGSAADKAGIQKGDVITGVGGRSIQDAEELTAAVSEQPAGATVKITLLRGGRQQQVDVTLGAAPKA